MLGFPGEDAVAALEFTGAHLGNTDHSWADGRLGRVHVRRIGEIKHRADIGLSCVTLRQMLQAKSLLEKGQDRGGIDVLMIDVMRPGGGGTTKFVIR